MDRLVPETRLLKKVFEFATLDVLSEDGRHRSPVELL
jgi:hypothetical protein